MCVCLGERHKHTIHYICWAFRAYQAAVCSVETGNPLLLSRFITHFIRNAHKVDDVSHQRESQWAKARAFSYQSWIRPLLSFATRVFSLMLCSLDFFLKHYFSIFYTYNLKLNQSNITSTSLTLLDFHYKTFNTLHLSCISADWQLTVSDGDTNSQCLRQRELLLVRHRGAWHYQWVVTCCPPLVKELNCRT